MIIIFIGIQGSGKGTQAKLLADKLKIPGISTGDVLRSVEGKLKEKVDNVMNRGELLSADLVMELLKERISNKDCKNGFILDGFPRDLEQAEKFDANLDADFIIELEISDKEVFRRLEGRRLCPKCGRGYNVVTSPKPKKDNLCDIDGAELVRRADDTEDSIKKRIEIYHEETEPILKRYKDKIIKINGEQKIENIFEDILEKLRIK
ncbi:MAG: nucleoside monophosphate kinase [archaeon]